MDETQPQPLPQSQEGGAPVVELTVTGDNNSGAKAPNPKAVVIDKVPENKICVRLLLISGLKTDLLFDGTDSVEAVKQHIFDSWPSDWTGETPEKPVNLRLLLRGKFLDDKLTLGAANFPEGQTTTCHLLIKNGAATAEPSPTTEAPKRSPTTAGNAAARQEPSSGCRCTVL